MSDAAVYTKKQRIRAETDCKSKDLLLSSFPLTPSDRYLDAAVGMPLIRKICSTVRRERSTPIVPYVVGVVILARIQ